MQIGELLKHNEHILEVCQSEGNACTHCFAVGKQYVCYKLPDCHDGLYFKKLSNHEIRQAKKQGKTINELGL